MKEQRKFTRHNVRHLLDFTTTDDRGKKTSFHMGRVLDISLGGMKIETPIDLSISSRVEITTGIAENLVDLVGKVTHTHKRKGRFVSGIQLLSISPENKSIITSYIEKELKPRDTETTKETEH